ncbi:MAG: S-layer homology domain-containing protein [Clostridiales bacterium]|nr:S-layer homology domain-containing protein [Clostridiales bacterium]
MNKLTKMLTASLTAVSMLGATAFAAAFTDIGGSQYAWAKSYIEDMAAKGYINGYEDGSFKPDKEVTNLEAIALFSRAMGALEEENKEILAAAHAQYDDTIKKYLLTWGQDEVAFMMYKGALKTSDLNTYLSSSRRDEPMKRYEAAIIITKAMGGETEATSQTGVSLNYTDKSEIPSNAIQYVYYATKQGIMEGMDDGGFSPLTSVLRSQMAVMLSRVVAKTEYSFENVHINSIDADAGKITVTNSDNAQEIYDIEDNTTFKIKGSSVQAADMISDVDAVLTLSGNKLVCVDATSDAPNETITGKYAGKTLSGGVTTIKITPSGSTSTKSYPCSDKLTVTYQGSPATLASISNNDTITISLVDGKVVSIVGEQKTITVSGAVVESLNITDDFTITISHADSAYDGKSYPVADNVNVMKDGIYVELAKIYKGDRVNLTLDYGVITKITATSTSKTVDGTIKEIRIAAQPTIIVTVNDVDKEYTVPSDATMTRDGNEATLYDFRVGDRVSIMLESDAVKRISTTSVVSSAGEITGTVEAVNNSFGFLSVIPTGSTTPQTVFFYVNKVTVLDKAGAPKNISSIKKGDTVYITGTNSNGAFTASVIIVTSES